MSNAPYGKHCKADIKSVEENINDIAGVRIICSFTSDIYRIADMIRNQKDIQVIGVKDYITYPKVSGYRSYHMIVTVPVYLSDRLVDTKVEIQIRTVAMDFWASLEHKLKYKTDSEVSSELAQQLKDCAETIAATDLKMQSIYKTLKELD